MVRGVLMLRGYQCYVGIDNQCYLGINATWGINITWETMFNGYKLLHG